MEVGAILESASGLLFKAVLAASKALCCPFRFYIEKRRHFDGFLLAGVLVRANTHNRGRLCVEEPLVAGEQKRERLVLQFLALKVDVC